MEPNALLMIEVLFAADTDVAAGRRQDHFRAPAVDLGMQARALFVHIAIKI
jgi:hypothetical protein